MSPLKPMMAFAAILLAGLFAATAPVSAETLADLDVLSDRSLNETNGLALAQEQAGQGAYLEALATLARVLAENPKSDGARLLHAFYLCKVDDKMGGAVELGKLKQKKYDAATLATVRSQCGMSERD